MLGTSAACAELLEQMQTLVATGRAPAAVADATAREMHAAGGKVPGFGHPVHKPFDRRAERILELADERRVSGAHIALARALHHAVADTWGKPLTLNVSMAIAAAMLDLGFPSASVRAVPILARTASLLAHLAEEEENPLGFLMASKAEEAIEYRPPAE